jgi:hypothetical protein
MDKLDTLDRGIRELRNMLSNGWRTIASGGLAPYERCEVRNQMVKAAGDLRLCLHERDQELRRIRELTQATRDGMPSVQLRFLNTDYEVTVAPVLPAAAPVLLPAQSPPMAPAQQPVASEQGGTVATANTRDDYEKGGLAAAFSVLSSSASFTGRDAGGRPRP